MQTITVKNIPNDLYHLIKVSAKRNRRSINKQVISYLENSVNVKKINIADFLVDVRKIRSNIPNIKISNEELNKIKNWGRP